VYKEHRTQKTTTHDNTKSILYMSYRFSRCINLINYKIQNVATYINLSIWSVYSCTTVWRCSTFIA